MEYQEVPYHISQQAINSNNPFTSSAQPAWQPNSYGRLSATQGNKASDSLTWVESQGSLLEDGYGAGLSDSEILAQSTEFSRRVPPPAYIPSALAKPVAVPQTVAGTGRSFARCWSPALTPYNVTEGDFVEFIDNLNVVSTASPPLQVLDLVGGVLGMVPHHIFQIAGNGVQVLAQLGTVVVSKSRTDMYMKMVNKDFFAPRGLQATICSRDAMVMALRLPNDAGRLAPITDENMNCSMLERRLEGLKPYMSELRFDVPSPRQQTTILAKISAGQVKRRTERAEKKALKQRHKQIGRKEEANDKLYEKQSKRQRKYEKEMTKLDRDAHGAVRHAEKDARKGGRSAEKAERKLGAELAKIEEERREVERELVENTRDGMGSSSKAEKKDKENKQAIKALWILIENL